MQEVALKKDMKSFRLEQAEVLGEGILAPSIQSHAGHTWDVQFIDTVQVLHSCGVAIPDEVSLQAYPLAPVVRQALLVYEISVAWTGAPQIPGVLHETQPLHHLQVVAAGERR